MLVIVDLLVGSEYPSDDLLFLRFLIGEYLQPGTILQLLSAESARATTRIANARTYYRINWFSLIRGETSCSDIENLLCLLTDYD